MSYQLQLFVWGFFFWNCSELPYKANEKLYNIINMKFTMLIRDFIMQIIFL